MQKALFLRNLGGRLFWEAAFFGFFWFSRGFFRFFWKKPKKKKHVFFGILLVPGLKNQKNTRCFVGFSLKSKKPSCFFGFQVLLASETKRNILLWGFSFKKPKKPSCSFDFQPAESKIQKTPGFCIFFKKTQENQKKNKKGGLPAPWFWVFGFWVFLKHFLQTISLLV